MTLYELQRNRYQRAIAVGMNPAFLDAVLETLDLNDAQAIGGAAGNGVVDDRAAIAALDTKVQASGGGTLWFTPGRYRVASNLTITSAVEFEPGAMLVPDAGVTITINGPLRAGLWQVFSCAAAGSAIAFNGAVLDAVYVQWFGAVGDGVTDDYPAFAAAMDSIPATGGMLRAPQITRTVTNGQNQTIYYLSQTLDFIKPIHLLGSFPTAQALAAFRGVTLRFAAGVHGIILDAYNTRAGVCVPGAPFTNTSAQRSIIENIRIDAAGATTTAYGVWMRVTSALKNVEISNFKTSQLRIWANSLDPVNIGGNANQWYAEQVYVSGGVDAWWIEGADTNAGKSSGCSAGGCSGYALYENSFLGNTHSGLHLDNTGGSGKNLWSGGAVSANFFDGIYAEGPITDNGANIGAATTIIAGLGASDSTAAQQALGSVMLGAQFKGAAPSWVNGLGGKTINTSMGSQGAYLKGFGFGCTTDDGVAILYSQTYNPTYRQWEWVRAGQPGLSPLDFPGSGGVMATLRASACRGRNGFYFGGGDDMQSGQLMNTAAAAPAAGTWVRGDRIFNSAPAVGQPKSWVCTVSGTPGTWVSEGNL